MCLLFTVRIVHNLEMYGSLVNRPSSARARTARSIKNIEALPEELNKSCHNVWNILHNDLHLYPYKIQLTETAVQIPSKPPTMELNVLNLHNP